jgi:hypothetical protein
VAEADHPLCPRRPLDFLASAYRATGDERYAVAGRKRLEPLSGPSPEQCGPLRPYFGLREIAKRILCRPVMDDA